VEGGKAASGEADDEVDGRAARAGRVRDMSLPQLQRYNGEVESAALESVKAAKMAHAYIALRHRIFDVTNGMDRLDLEKWRPYFGQHKADAPDEELAFFQENFHEIGKVIEQRVISREQLRAANGKDGGPIYIAARGLVFDVSSGESFYGPEGGYHLFAGKIAQRALALMSLNQEDVENTNLDDLEPKDLKVLDDWIDRYFDKYPLIGLLQEQKEERRE